MLQTRAFLSLWESLRFSDSKRAKTALRRQTYRIQVSRCRNVASNNRNRDEDSDKNRQHHELFDNGSHGDSKGVGNMQFYYSNVESL